MGERIFRDASKPVKERVDDLMSDMTLEEKVGQLCTWWHTYYFMKDFEGTLEKTLKHGLGAIQWLIPGFEPEENVKIMNRIQKYAIENTRLGIPVLFDGEALAGGLFYGATYFPTAIGLASTWEPELIGEMCQITRKQMYEYGVRLVFSPVLDIARDPRWGRIGETYGEDPYLASQIGKAFVKAMQGENLSAGIAATGKHFLGYGAGEGGINKNVVNIGPRELYEIYALPFEAVIRDSGVKAIMNSYGVIDNVPIAGSREILTNLLKMKLGFNGVVFSDNFAIQQMVVRNKSADSMEEAAVRALVAGIDIDVSEPPVYLLLKDVVENGRIDISLIDGSVRKVLELKFELGLFESPYARGEVKKAVYTEENNIQAYKTAVKSLVLLKNEDKLLPLSGDLKSIAVIGPNADSLRCFFGGYSSVAMHELTTEAFSGDTDGQEQSNMIAYGRYGDPNVEDSFTRYFYPDCTSVLQAVKGIISDTTSVYYSKGCNITDKSTEGIAEAVEAAAKADMAIVVLGGIDGMGSGTTCGEGRDRMDLSMPGAQLQLLQAVYRTGTPIVLVVISSNPLDLSWAKEHIPAIIQAWSPGQAAGDAIANVLLGKEVPCGKLPLTMLASTGHIPLYYNRKPVFEDPNCITAYIDGPNGCVYPFGHGLSYTEFKYGELIFENRQVDSQGCVRLSFTLENIGDSIGEEVVQVYFHDPAASVSRPIKQLVGFKRVRLDKGAKCRITFSVDMEMLAFYDMDMNFVVEPGSMEVYIGSSSYDIRLQDRFDITGSVFNVKERRVFSSKVSIEHF